MDVTRFLGTHRFLSLMELGRSEGCAWHLLRRELDGARYLAQFWSPLPADRDLDHIRDTFLSRFLDAAPLDPVYSHIGFDSEQAWYLQAIHGTPLSRCWSGWGEAQREALLAHLSQQLDKDLHPRFLHPEVITLRPGLTQVPRVIGRSPWGLDKVPDFLPQTAPVPALSEDLPWVHPRDLSEPLSRPLRGRSQELPYLKSLMLGFSAPIPMERIVLLQGEEGVGKEHLASWACAVAEGEGIWVHHLATSSGETPGRFLGRLLEALLMGSEVDFYAERPEAAKTLSLRVQAFAFLTGGRHVNRQESGPEPEEVKAALEALDFAGLLHPRLLHLAGLDHATPEVLTLIRELIHASSVPWLLSLTTGAQGAGLKPLIAQLRGEPAAALVGMNRLEDEDLRLVMNDLLGSHDLPEAFQTDLITQSLGNPGLLRNFLELAHQSGSLMWAGNRWSLAPGKPVTLKAEADLMRQIFLGRLQRLPAASATLVRLLALAERPLPAEAIGRLLGLHGDALEDALQGAVGSRLAQLQRDQAMIPDPRWRELVLTHTPQPELKRLARALSTAFLEQGWDCSVPLQSLASDEATALAAVLASLDQGLAGPPAETRRVVGQALLLKPSPLDEGRLYEHLADAWASGIQALGETSERPPAEEALLALERALEACAHAPQDEDLRLREARLFRKRAMLNLQLRQPSEAQVSLQAAAGRLAEHPLHLEQPRLRLALGQLHLLQGHLTKGIRALEEGLHPQGGYKPMPHRTRPPSCWPWARPWATSPSSSAPPPCCNPPTGCSSMPRASGTWSRCRSPWRGCAWLRANPRPASCCSGRPCRRRECRGIRRSRPRGTSPSAWCAASSSCSAPPSPTWTGPSPGPSAWGIPPSCPTSRSGGPAPMPPWGIRSPPTTPSSRPWPPSRPSCRRMSRGIISFCRPRWPASGAPGGTRPGCSGPPPITTNPPGCSGASAWPCSASARRWRGRPASPAWRPPSRAGRSWRI